MLKHSGKPLWLFSTSMKPLNVILVRHAESVFNAKCHQYPLDQIYSKQAQQQFHYDTSIVDCSLTQRGFAQEQYTNLANRILDKKLNEVIFFVSPMLRTLQTAHNLIRPLKTNGSIKMEVRIAPLLSEIMSKICDLCSGINQKRQMFKQFDFGDFDDWVKDDGTLQGPQCWQDLFLDQNLRSKVEASEKVSARYLKILKTKFPQPLETRENCQERSIEAFRRICQVSASLSYTNAVIVSHNRILKNIQSFLKSRSVPDYDNLQARQMNLVIQIKPPTSL